MAITIAARKAKGRKLQKMIAEQISQLLGIPHGKDELIQSREMGQSGVDVKLIGEARKKFPFSVECKAQEKLAIPEWIKQAKQNQIEGTDWLLFCKRKREDSFVIMDTETFFNLLKGKQS